MVLARITKEQVYLPIISLKPLKSIASSVFKKIAKPVAKKSIRIRNVTYR